MKIFLSAVPGIFFLLVGQALAGEPAEAGQDSGSQEEQMATQSYSLGYRIGIQMKSYSGELDPDTFLKAFRTGIAGDKAALSDQEMRDALRSLREEMQAKQAEWMKSLAENNRQEGATFLAENAAKQGVVSRPSGLQFKVIKAGAGESPAATDKVTVNYRGSFVNGREFDSSYKRKRPATFRVGNGSAWWKEGIQLMQEGARWQFFIPANLAYGEKGVIGKKNKRILIPPNAVVIYDVELVSIEAAPAEVLDTPDTPEHTTREQPPPTKSGITPQAGSVDDRLPMAAQ